VDTTSTTRQTGQSERTRRVRLLCRNGYAHYDAGEPARALRHFYRAWLLLPRPQHACVESGWILTAIAARNDNPARPEREYRMDRGALDEPMVPQRGGKP
jgi:hypothetical protein